MDEGLLRGLVDRLRTPVAKIRSDREQTPGLMPDDAPVEREPEEGEPTDAEPPEITLRSDLEDLVAEYGVGVDPLIFWAVVGCLLYCDADADLALARIQHAVGYLRWWQHREGEIVFRDLDLLQLMFLYALGVRRPAGGVPGETPAQAQAWGVTPWAGAFDALRWYLLGLAGWLFAGLRRLGFHRLELLGKFHGAPDGHYARQLAIHTIGVLLGDTQCVCVKLFRDANPGSPPGAAERRHKEWHLLTGYLDKHWPEGRDYHRKPYGISQHIFRAVCGDRPTRPREFEKGIWFPFVTSADSSLEVIKVLVCRHCRAHLSRFDECPTCGRDWPENALTDWLTTEDDRPTRFRTGEGKECRRCSPVRRPEGKKGPPLPCWEMVPLDEPTCRCGSPGLGFSKVIAGTRSQVECLAPECGWRMKRTIHRCPNPQCLNADFGGATNFYLKQEAPEQADVDAASARGPHQGSGHRRPLPPKPAEPDGPEEEPTDDYDPPEPDRPSARMQTPSPAAVSPAKPRTDPRSAPASAPETIRAGMPAIDDLNGSHI